ncbi:4Fe-4S binding protein [Nonomuraea sp. CA-141351]|uniref:4Fe-4S binding protein n=1 Tax=Nonomuraea sp. CA-141351 TaxID=3239996 RepID=UPI003D933BF9
MLCARECPDWCIYIDSHKETIPAPEGGRPRQRNVLDRFAIDFSLCMYCGICIEVCPFDALFWSPEFEYAEGDIRNLIHEKDKLAAWTQTVPPPPAHDPGAESPKELTAAPRRPATARTPGGSRASVPTSTTQEPKPRPEAEERESTTGSAETRRAKGAQPSPDTRDIQVTAGTEETTPKSGPAETAAQDAGPAANAPEAGPATPSRTQGVGGRPRRPMQNVRGIRPPGALPSPSEDETPTSSAEGGPPSRPATPGGTNAGAEAEPDSTLSTEDGRPTTTPSGEDGQATTTSSEEDGASSGEDGGTTASSTREDGEPTPDPSGEQPSPGMASSTDKPSPEKLSTASGAPQPEPDPGQQTSATSPRRRRMADPRSIRPPGRLGPDETGESEEES